MSTSRMSEREHNVYKAELAHQVERYGDMLESMKKVAAMNVELTSEERNLLLVACNNFIGARRNSCKMITSIQNKVENIGAADKLAIVKTYREQVEQELRDICSDILNVLEQHLLPHAASAESKMFYYKMMADYYRYLSELAGTSNWEDAAENSVVGYKAAYDIAMNDLPPPHPIRLRLAHDLSVLYYKILKSPELALRLANNAFKNAISELDSLTQENSEESDEIMELLADNINLWSCDVEPQDEGEENERSQEVKDQDEDDQKES